MCYHYYKYSDQFVFGDPSIDWTKKCLRRVNFEIFGRNMVSFSLIVLSFCYLIRYCDVLCWGDKFFLFFSLQYTKSATEWHDNKHKTKEYKRKEEKIEFYHICHIYCMNRERIVTVNALCIFINVA